jgi:hypothetical protein
MSTRSFNTTLLGVPCYVQYYYTPEERSSMDGPGCNESAEIHSIHLSTPTGPWVIDGKDIEEAIYSDLEKECLADVHG